MVLFARKILPLVTLEELRVLSHSSNKLDSKPEMISSIVSHSLTDWIDSSQSYSRLLCLVRSWPHSDNDHHEYLWIACLGNPDDRGSYCLWFLQDCWSSFWSRFSPIVSTLSHALCICFLKLITNQIFITLPQHLQWVANQACKS